MHFGMGGEWDEYITTTLEMEYKKKKKKKNWSSYKSLRVSLKIKFITYGWNQPHSERKEYYRKKLHT